MRALFPDEARELGVRDSDWELLVEELVEVLSTFVLVKPSTFVLVKPSTLVLVKPSTLVLVKQLRRANSACATATGSTSVEERVELLSLLY